MELVRFPSRGGFSVRSVFTFALTVVITALLWATFSSTAAQAAPEATWRGTDTLLFDNHGYTRAADFKDTTGTIPDGAIVYKSPVQPGTSSSPDQKVLVLFFSPGVDPPTADTATYVEFTYKNGELSNPQGQQSVAVAPPDESGNSGSSCAVDGIGWIVCPVSTFLADAMDNMFNVLATFIEAKPLVLGDTSNSMYLAWDTMRTIANVAFVIAFLVIIYSQLTNVGISNYGLKKLIPRLIVAAVLVNLSFYITAIAIDISNILGYSLQNLFNVIREQTFHLTNDNLSGFNTNIWGQVTAAVLAGGGLVGGFYYMAAGGPYLLVSLLIGLLLTLLFVVLILAARQAIIVILVIISPLAFVANLLPNTEKLFDKWKDLFMTMLVFFPAFSLVFGGSQLAGEIIIQNAGDNIIMLIFGLAVQVAPLVITPLILKLSGTLLGRIAQIANNPRKGLIDRSRNWGERRAEHAKQQNIARGARLKNPSSWGAGMVRGMDYRRRRLSDKTDIWKQEATNRYEETGKYGDIHTRKTESDLNKERIHNQHAEHIEHLKAAPGNSLHDAAMAAQVSKDAAEVRQQQTAAYYNTQRATNGTALNIRTVELENAKVSAELASARTDSMVSAYRAGVYETEGNERLTNLQHRMAENVIQTSAWKLADESHQYVRQRAVSERVQSDNSLLDIAQGYGTPEARIVGRERAQASAEATLNKLDRDARENTINLMETEAVMSGMTVKDFAIKRVFATANSADPAQRQTISRSRLEAALEIAAKDGQVTVFDEARSSEHIDQTIVDAVVARHVGDMKSKGGFHIQAQPELSLQRYIQDFNAGKRSESSLDAVREAFETDLKRARLGTLSNTNSANLGGVKFGAFANLASDMFSTDPRKNLLNAIPVDADGKPTSEADAQMLQRIFESLRDGLEDPTIRGTMTDRLAFARNMEEGIRERFFPDKPPLTLSETERAKAGGGSRPASMAENSELPTPPAEPTAGAPLDADPDADASNDS